MGRQARHAALNAFCARPVRSVAAELLGGVLAHADDAGTIAVRLTEVEAYGGAEDPGSHAYRGRTARNDTMFGPPGRLYCYLSYGVHWLLNIVCQDPDDPAAVLLRAGEVLTGHDPARQRRTHHRGRAVADRDLARGPGCLGQVFGAGAHTDGAVLTVLPAGPYTSPAATEPRADGSAAAEPRTDGFRAADLPAGWSFTPPQAPVACISGPRVGVAGPGGDPTAFAWRFHIPDDPTVSRFVPGRGTESS